MAKKIILKSDISNDSIQIGDTAYYVGSVSNNSSGFKIIDQNEIPKPIGVITSVGGDFIIIEIPVCAETKPSADDFIMFQKDRKVNNTSLLGYYAEIKLINNSTEKAEMFALSSDITASSK